MEKTYSESGYRFAFHGSLNAYKADARMFNDLTAVDFVVETEKNFLFVEVKNPDNQHATIESRRRFLKDMLSPAFPYQIGGKFKDTLLRNWVCGESLNKPVICVFILEFLDFTKSERGKLKEKLVNRIPFSLNKTEFGGKKHLERFELLSVDEFRIMFPGFSVKLEESEII